MCSLLSSDECLCWNIRIMLKKRLVFSNLLSRVIIYRVGSRDGWRETDISTRCRDPEAQMFRNTAPKRDSKHPCHVTIAPLHHQRHTATERHDHIHFQWRAGVYRGQEPQWPLATECGRVKRCGSSDKSLGLLNVMQMNSEFRKRQPIGVKNLSAALTRHRLECTQDRTDFLRLLLIC